MVGKLYRTENGNETKTSKKNKNKKKSNMKMSQRVLCYSEEVGGLVGKL